MKILAAIKQVPSRDSVLRAGASRRWIDETGLTFEINEPDAYALEEALQLKEKHGGEAAVLCAGPGRAASSIREALAKGADRAIHVDTGDGGEWDALGLATLLARAAGPEHPDLILTGLQSDDLGLGQTGVILAELLGLPHATIIMHVEASAGAVRLKRELEDGWFQYVDLPLPAVLTIQSGINRLRYATLMGIKKAKTKEIKVIPAGSLGAVPPPVAALESIFVPKRAKRTVMIEGSAQQQAARLLEKLRTEARVL